MASTKVGAVHSHMLRSRFAIFYRPKSRPPLLRCWWWKRKFRRGCLARVPLCNRPKALEGSGNASRSVGRDTAFEMLTGDFFRQWFTNRREAFAISSTYSCKILSGLLKTDRISTTLIARITELNLVILPSTNRANFESAGRLLFKCQITAARTGITHFFTLLPIPVTHPILRTEHCSWRTIFTQNTKCIRAGIISERIPTAI